MKYTHTHTHTFTHTRIHTQTQTNKHMLTDKHTHTHNIYIYYIEGITNSELAELLGMERVTVGTRLHRIRQTLQESLEK